MDCDSIRTAISAAQDGEDPGVPADVVRAHLEGCAECRAWQERQHGLTRQIRLGGPALDHDLAPAVLAALPDAAVRPRRMRWRRPEAARKSAAWIPVALALLAAAQFAITVPLLFLGRDHDASAHAAHELGSFDLALAIAFVVGAARPRLSAGLAWPCCIAAGGLAVTALLGIVEGQTPGADEAQHLVAVAGALLLFWQARPGAGVAQPGAAVSPVPEGNAALAALPWQWRQADGGRPDRGHVHPGTPVAADPAPAQAGPQRDAVRREVVA